MPSFASDLEDLLRTHSTLDAELPQRADGTRIFPIRLPSFVDGREILHAYLHVPPKFPEMQSLEIWLPKSMVLKVPHVEESGKLCFDGDPGSTSGASPEARIERTLSLFYDRFCIPWNQGRLDDDFRKEALNYWRIYYSQRVSKTSPVTRILLIKDPTKHAQCENGIFIPTKRIVLSGDHDNLNKVYPIIGNKDQIINVQIAYIPIKVPLTPDTWPKNQGDLERLFSFRLSKVETELLIKSVNQKGKPIHSLVILSAPECSFGFLLPGGPNTHVQRSYNKDIRMIPEPLPLPVERLDTSWICGRDQHPEIRRRQKQKVLVIGVGALGSFVVEHLVKAGVGHLSLVDPDFLSAANLGRHALGEDDLGKSKVEALASQIEKTWHAISVEPFSCRFESWLEKKRLGDYDLILDLTGEPSVRLHLECARKRVPCPLLIGWMEPFSAAAHACLLPAGQPWSQTPCDPLYTCKAIEWPEDVIQREPGCSSQFQSYTHAAASHAVAMISEAALSLLDGEISVSLLRSLVRGRRFLDKVKPGLAYREWSAKAADSDSMIWDRPWNG